MITLEQVHLLEQKVESAVVKIGALSSENAELRKTLNDISAQNSEFAKKNAELAEMLSLYEEDQSRIEKGILNALNRLNDVENSVLKAGSAVLPQPQPVIEQTAPPPEPQEEKPAEQHSPDGQIDIF